MHCYFLSRFLHILLQVSENVQISIAFVFFVKRKCIPNSVFMEKCLKMWRRLFLRNVKKKCWNACSLKHSVFLLKSEHMQLSIFHDIQHWWQSFLAFIAIEIHRDDKLGTTYISTQTNHTVFFFNCKMEWILLTHTLIEWNKLNWKYLLSIFASTEHKCGTVLYYRNEKANRSGRNLHYISFPKWISFYWKDFLERE